MSKAGRFQFSTDPAFNPKSLEDLLAIPAGDLPFCDIARLNLACAIGLPGAENLDIDRCIHTINKWTNRVEFETRRHLYRATDSRYVGRYGGSKAKLSAEMVLQVLMEDCGVKYNPKRVLDPDFRNSKDLFIHGMIDDPNGGTCCSMPVLYAAIARRLRYPVKLMHAKAHLLCRWDGSKEQFSIEATAPGIIFRSDEHYRKWPESISDEEIRRGEYMAPLSPAEEVAGFFAARAWCLEDHGRTAEAIKAYEVACRLHPGFPAYRAFRNALLRKQNPMLGVPGQLMLRRTPQSFGAPPIPNAFNGLPMQPNNVPQMTPIPYPFGGPHIPHPINMRHPFNGRP